MGGSGKEDTCYNIEREFLSDITIKDMIANIIRSHGMEDATKNPAFQKSSPLPKT